MPATLTFAFCAMLCALVKPGLAVTSDNLLDRMLGSVDQAWGLDAEGGSLGFPGE